MLYGDFLHSLPAEDATGLRNFGSCKGDLLQDPLEFAHANAHTLSDVRLLFFHNGREV